MPRDPHSHRNVCRAGEVTAWRAARLIGVHRETIYRWIQDCLAGRESRLPPGCVRKSITGRYFLLAADVERIIAEFYEEKSDPGGS